MNRAHSPLTRLALFAFCLLCAACAGQSAVRTPAVSLATDGPPLAIVGEYDGMALVGSMDRTGMTGYGGMILSAANADREFVCEAKIDDPPTEKGRVRGLLHCTGERQVLFTLRNIGPDQGVGVGRESEDGALLILFYHSSAEEAQRRFPSVKEDIDRARSGRQ